MTRSLAQTWPLGAGLSLSQQLEDASYAGTTAALSGAANAGVVKASDDVRTWAQRELSCRQLAGCARDHAARSGN